MLDEVLLALGPERALVVDAQGRVVNVTASGERPRLHDELADVVDLEVERKRRRGARR